MYKIYQMTEHIFKPAQNENYLKYKETYQNYYQNNKEQLLAEQKIYYKKHKRERQYFQKLYYDKLAHSRAYRNYKRMKKEEKNQELIARKREQLLSSIN
jgi:hypothetical protein